MKYTRMVRILKSIVYGVSLTMTSSLCVSSALATSQFGDESDVAIDVVEAIDIDRKVSRLLSSAIKLQNEQNRQADKITLQNILSVKDLEIFGSEMMTKSELAKFRNDLKQVKTQDQLEQYLADHRARMNVRATKRGVVLD